jgi:hypothetical protein
MVSNLNPNGSSNPQFITAAGEKIFYFATDGTNSGLWVDAGTCTERLWSDLNLDCKVDFNDFTVMALEWMECRAESCD